MTASDTEQLRLTVLLDSESIPAWQFSLLERLRRRPSLSIQTVVNLSVAGDSHPASLTRRVFDKLARYDRPRISPDADASNLTSVASLNLGCPVACLESDESGGAQAMAERIREFLEKTGQDIVLHLGDASLLDTLVGYNGSPIWYFDHGPGQADEYTLGFWEVTSRSACLYSALHVRDIAGRDLIAYESWSPVHNSSFTRTRNEHLWKLPHFVLRALDKQRSTREIPRSFKADDMATAPASHSLREQKDSSVLVFWRALGYLLYRSYKALTNRVFDERWVLQFCPAGEFADIRRSSVIRPPPDRFWADPYLVERDQEYFLFFEDASTRTGRGRISVMTIDVDGSISVPRPVLERPYHLSYPFVFEYEGETYMIPETAENRSIELYRCKQFPDQWEFVHNLMDDVSAYDATIVYHDEWWWMFVNIREDAGMSSWDELYIFYSDSPVSQKWRAHSDNPVVTDVRKARPAGRIFVQDGMLYRPSQNSSFRYGYGLKLNRIVELSHDRFAEEQILSITPDRHGPTRGIHTVTQSDTLIVTDAMLRAPRFRRSQVFRD